MLARVSVTFAVALAFALAGCERETTPPLIEVRGVSPHEVEEGDRLTIEGIGFPEGKVAHVTFRGDLHRPGVPVVTGVVVPVDAVVGSSSELDIPFDAALEKLFAGAGDRAAHTTFSGEVTVAFAARTPAAPPVAGTLHDAWLDVRVPTPHRAVAEAEAAEGARTLAFLGIVPQASALTSGGIVVESIVPGGRADTVRLLPGDVIVEAEGVRVLSLRDLVMVPGARATWLKIRRAGSPHEEIARVSLLGLKPPAMTALLPPVLIIGLAAVLLLLFFSPAPMLRALGWLERALSTRLRGKRLELAPLLSASKANAGVWALASLILAVLPFAHALGLGEIDAGNLFLLSVTSLTVLAVCTLGAVAGLREALRVASLAIPAAALVVAVVLTSGSLGIEDIVRTQSGSPWGWTLFKTPLAIPLFVLTFVAVHAGRTSTDTAKRSRLFGFATAMYLVALAALMTALCLGGWQVPGLAVEKMEGQLGWTTVGALVYVMKTGAFAFAVVTLSNVLPAVPTRDAMALAWRWLVPLALLSLLLTGVWVMWGPGPSAEGLVRAVMLALSGAVVLHIVTSVRRALKTEAPAVDPFV